MQTNVIAWPDGPEEDFVETSLTPDMVMYNGHVKVNVSEFKAKCLSIVDKAARGEEVRIMKRGKVVARLVPDAEVQPKPWLALRSVAAVWHGDPLAPAVATTDIDAERS